MLSNAVRRTFILALLCSAAIAQNVRYSASFPSVTSQYATPFLVANVPPNSPVLAVCKSPANGTPCTNYAQTTTSAGVNCPNGAQDTPDPQPSNCQSTGDAQGNIGFWAAPGQYDYTVCVATNCFGPYTVTLGSDNTIQTVAHITSAQIKALGLGVYPGPSIVIIPAPGAGKLLNIMSVNINYVFVAPAYTVDPSADLALSIGIPGSGGVLLAAIGQVNLIDQAHSVIWNQGSINGFNDTPVSGIINQPLALYNESGPPATVGNGTLTITILYNIIDAA